MPYIKKITVNEFFADPLSSKILKEYGEECCICGMPEPNPNRETYRLMESGGFMHVWGAFDGGELVGCLVLLLAENPHYSSIIGTIESIFVEKDRRAGGAGKLLLNKAKSFSKDNGATGVFISAPASGVFSKVLKGSGVKHTNDVFFWGLNE